MMRTSNAETERRYSECDGRLRHVCWLRNCIVMRQLCGHVVKIGKQLLPYVLKCERVGVHARASAAHTQVISYFR